MAKDTNKRVKYGKSIKRGNPPWMKDTKYHMKNKVKIR